MTTCLMIGATRAYALEERAATKSFFRIELEDIEFSAARAVEWLNEHTNEVLRTTEFNDLRAFQTPGRRRLVRVPSPKRVFDPEAIARGEIDADEFPIEPIVNRTFEPVVPVAPVQSTQQAEAIVATDEPQHEQEEPELETEEVQIVQDAQETHNPSATHLYTESEIGSPSTHATPDMPVRHGSFSFASLPPREMLQSIRQQSLGLDSDATEEDPVYVRAPELVAHEERMRAYDEPTSPPEAKFAPSPVQEVVNVQPQTATTAPSVRRTRSMTQKEQEDHEDHEDQRIAELQRSLGVADVAQTAHDTTVTQSITRVTPEEHGITDTHMQDNQHEQDIDVAMQQEEHAVADAAQEEEQEQANQHINAASREHSDEASQDEQSAEEAAQESAPTKQSTNATTQDTTAKGSRLRAPRNLGRPVRPTNAGTMIKIKSLTQQRPVNTAPVAAHNNQDTRRVKARPPTQPVRPAPKQPLSAPKSFAAAQRKKEQDERAAERDAAVKRQQKERREAKQEELRTKKREDQETAEREARRKSNELADKHIKDLDETNVFRAKLETRQEREEEKVAEKKKENLEKIINRQNALQGRVYGSSSYRPLTAMDLNHPARPASRLEMHDQESDPINEPATTENVPPRSIHNQVTRTSSFRPTAVQRPLQRQSQQQDGALPPYPSNLHKAPVRASALQRPGPIFQSTIQNTSNTINAFPAPPTRGPDMRQFATQRPPMANEAPPQQPRAQPPQAQYQLPQAPSSSARPQPHPNRTRLIQAVAESSPAESIISLPEIHTDSSEESDRHSLASWVSPGHIFHTLATQETFDPDRIFGPIRRVAIDDVFGAMPAEKRRRLNMRTSSANWVRTGDALTQVEVVEDKAARQAIREHNGWVYNP